ncbi:MAG: transglutaminase-like domain-containing protein [candidate division WOR-3 bacterium]
MRLISLFFLILVCGGKPRPARPIAEGRIALRPEQTWYSFYLAGQKIGYAVYRNESLPDGFRFEALSRMNVGMLGTSQSLRTRSVARTGRDLTLRSFEFELSSRERSFSAWGELKERALLITEKETGRRRSIPVTGPVYPIEALGMLVIRAEPEPGKTAIYNTFDGAVMDVLPCEVTVIGPDSVTVEGRSVQALKIRTRRAKLSSTNWLAQDGTSLVERTDIGLEAVLTGQEQALAGETESAKLDILALFRVKVDTVISEPDRVQRLVVEVSGVDTADFRLAGPNQRLIAANPLTLEITTPALPDGPVPLPVRAEHEFLKPSVSVQCDDPQIRAKAQEIIESVEDGREAARLLMEWVYRSLRKEATASFPNAKDVLKHLAGDCNEHAVLYAALARAAGIPARVVAGLVYMEGAFYYHAWNEVFLGSWIPVDATFGQFPASAVHLKIVEGDMAKQAEVLGVVKKIGIKVLQFE